MKVKDEEVLWLAIYHALRMAIASLRRRDDSEKARMVYISALISIARAIAQSGAVPPEMVIDEHRPLEPPTG
jgi:hypothetical protein